MAVALVALFVSLGGVSWGVASGTIGTRQIRNNSVRTQDIRNSKIRGKDVRRNTLTGSDVLESNLGKVPRAGLADVAFSPVAYARVAASGDARDRHRRLYDRPVARAGPVGGVAELLQEDLAHAAGQHPVDQA